jgi:hypothetical protein
LHPNGTVPRQERALEKDSERTAARRRKHKDDLQDQLGAPLYGPVPDRPSSA